MTTLSDRETRLIAYHEAGHAVVASLLRIPFIDVMVHTKARVVRNHAVMSEVGVSLLLGGRMSLRSRASYCLRDLEELALMSMAGSAVTKRLERRSWNNVLSNDGRGDFQQSVSFLDLALPRFWTYQYLKLVRSRALRVAELYWELIEKVADALNRRRKLTRAEVMGVIEGRHDFDLPVSIFSSVPEDVILFFSANRQQCEDLPRPEPFWLNWSRALTRHALPIYTGLSSEQLERGERIKRVLKNAPSLRQDTNNNPPGLISGPRSDREVAA